MFALIVVAGCTLRHHGPRLYVGVFRFEAAVALAPHRPAPEAAEKASQHSSTSSRPHPPATRLLSRPLQRA